MSKSSSLCRPLHKPTSCDITQRVFSSKAIWARSRAKRRRQIRCLMIVSSACSTPYSARATPSCINISHGRALSRRFRCRSNSAPPLQRIHQFLYPSSCRRNSAQLPVPIRRLSQIQYKMTVLKRTLAGTLKGLVSLNKPRRSMLQLSRRKLWCWNQWSLSRMHHQSSLRA